VINELIAHLDRLRETKDLFGNATSRWAAKPKKDPKISNFKSG
jgi:hypothetical protein